MAIVLIFLLDLLSLLLYFIEDYLDEDVGFFFVEVSKLYT